jgi:hypothetical protein
MAVMPESACSATFPHAVLRIAKAVAEPRRLGQGAQAGWLCTVEEI